MFKVFVATITDTNSYALLMRRSLRFALSYFMVMLFLLSALASIKLLTTILPQAMLFVESALVDLNQNYPENLQLEIKNGELTASGAAKPVEIPLSRAVAPFQRLAVINTGVEAEKIKDYKSVLFLNRHNLTYTLNPAYSNLYIIPWSDITPGITINRDNVVNSTTFISQNLAKLKPYLYPLTLAAVFLNHLVLRVIYLVIHTGILFFLLQLLQKPLKYGAVFRVCLYTIILTETLWTLAGLVYGPLPGSFYSLAFYPISLIALISARRTLTLLVTPK